VNFLLTDEYNKELALLTIGKKKFSYLLIKGGGKHGKATNDKE